MRLLLNLCLILLLSCQKNDNKTTLLLDWLPNPNHIPLYVGQELQFFKEAGIDLEILKSNDQASSMGHLSFGQVDLVVTYMPSFAKAELQGAKAHLIAKLIDEPLDGILFFQDGTIQTPKDLSGLRFGYATNSTSSNLQHLLKKNQIVPQKTLHCSFDIVGMLLTKQVDAIYGAYYTIEGEQLKSRGFPLGVFTFKELGFPTYYELVIAAKGPHPTFAKALQKAIDFCKAHPEEAFEIYSKMCPEKSVETLAWEKKSWKETLPILPANQTIDPQILGKLKEWFSMHSLEHSDPNLRPSTLDRSVDF